MRVLEYYQILFNFFLKGDPRITKRKLNKLIKEYLKEIKKGKNKERQNGNKH